MIETNRGIKDHPLLTTLDSLSAAVSGLRDSELYSPNQERLDRFASLLKLLESNIKGSQDALTPSFAVEEAQQHLQNCISQITSFRENHSSHHVSSALSDLESAIRVFPSAYRLRDPKQTEEYVEQISITMSDFVARANSDRDELQASIAAMEGNIAALRAQAAEQESELQRIRDDAKATLTSINDEFQNRQIERSNSFADLVQKFNERLSHLVEEKKQEANETEHQRETDFQAMSQRFRGEFDALLQEGQKTRDQILHLAGLAGTEALVGKFSSVAKAQDFGASIYRFLAYAGFVAAALYMVYVTSKLPPSLTPTELFQSMLAKSQIAIFTLIPSTFMAIELRRVNRSRARLKELELLISAFGPFVDDLPEPDRVKLKQSMAPVFFTAEASKKDKDASLTDEHIKMVRDLIRPQK